MEERVEAAPSRCEARDFHLKFLFSSRIYVIRQKNLLSRLLIASTLRKVNIAGRVCQL